MAARFASRLWRSDLCHAVAQSEKAGESGFGLYHEKARESGVCHQTVAWFASRLWGSDLCHEATQSEKAGESESVLRHEVTPCEKAEEAESGLSLEVTPCEKAGESGSGLSHHGEKAGGSGVCHQMVA